MKGTAALLILAWYVLCIALAVGSTALSIYGIYLAFCASVILGVVTIFVPPAALSFGAVQFFFHVNLPTMILQWLATHHG